MTNELILKYSKYIYSLTKYFDGYNSKEDLYQVGCIGLIEAYKNYDKEKGAKFTTYAYPYILGEMKKLVRGDKGIKISREITKLNLKIEKANILLAQKLMRYPTIKELSDYLEIPEDSIAECLKTQNIIQSIDEPIIYDSKEVTLHEVIPERSKNINTLLALKEELKYLTNEDRKIIEGRYLYDYTQTEIASSLGLTQVQVSRKEQKIKNKIKSHLMI